MYCVFVVQQSYVVLWYRAAIVAKIIIIILMNCSVYNLGML